MSKNLFKGTLFLNSLIFFINYRHLKKGIFSWEWELCEIRRLILGHNKANSSSRKFLRNSEVSKTDCDFGIAPAIRIDLALLVTLSYNLHEFHSLNIHLFRRKNVSSYF